MWWGDFDHVSWKSLNQNFRFHENKGIQDNVKTEMIS